MATPELKLFADRVASILTENPSMVALRERLAEDLRRSVDFDRLTSQMRRDIAAGGALPELQIRLAGELREQFAASPVLREFQRELSASLRLDAGFTESVRELLGPRAVPVEKWKPVFQTLRQGTGIDTEAVETEMRAASAEVEADASDDANWLLRMSRRQRAALLLAAIELAWAISQLAIAGTGHKEASPQVQSAVQVLLALIAVLVVLVPPDD